MHTHIERDSEINDASSLALKTELAFGLVFTVFLFEFWCPPESLSESESENVRLRVSVLLAFQSASRLYHIWGGLAGFELSKWMQRLLPALLVRLEDLRIRTYHELL